MSATVKSEAAPSAIAYPTLYASVAWTTVGNVVNALAQWGVIVLFPRLGNAAMVGRYELGLAMASPVFPLSSLNLRTVQTAGASAMGYVLSPARRFAAQAQLWGVAVQVVLSVPLLAPVIRSKGVAA